MSIAEQLMARVGAHGVDLEAVGHASRPTFTPEEVANGVQGLARNPFCAALYTLAGDDSVRGEICRWLGRSLLTERERQGWAAKVTDEDGYRGPFTRQLIDLFMLEERQPAICQVAPVIRLVVMNVSEATWRRSLAHQYWYVASEYRRALLDAEDHIRRKLSRG